MSNSLFSELKRRNVFRVMVAYIVMSWLILQVVDLFASILDLPDVFAKAVLVLLVLGFVVAVVISWIYEYTPDGLVREKPAGEDESGSRTISKKLDLITIIMVVLGIAFVSSENLIFDKEASVIPKSISSTPTQPESKPPEKTVVTDDLSIAVLPFVNMSSDKENEYFADGLTEELLNQLAQIASLKVTGRTSSFSYKNKNIDLRTIGETLGVAHILEGSVRRGGNQVRVTAQLIRASDGFHLWSETYDNTLDDIFAVQDDISTSVARALKIILSDEAIEKMQNAGIRNVDAFIAYQKGKELFNLAHGVEPLIPTLEKGLVYFDEALSIVPEFSTAHSEVSDYYAHLMMHSEASLEVRQDALVKIRGHFDAAAEHAPDDATRHAANFDRVVFSDDWSSLTRQAELIFETSTCLLPNWLEILIPFGYAQPIQESWDRYRECDPLSISYPLQVASTKMWQGNTEEALNTVLDAEKEFGSNPWFASFKQTFLLALGRTEEALAMADEVAKDETFGLNALVGPYAYMGDKDRAQKALDEWRKNSTPADGSMMLMYAFLGEQDKANELAAKIDAEPSGPLQLLVFMQSCFCGAPFDIEYTPVLKERVEEAGLVWPPKALMKYPLKGY